MKFWNLRFPALPFLLVRGGAGPEPVLSGDGVRGHRRAAVPHRHLRPHGHLLLHPEAALAIGGTILPLRLLAGAFQQTGVQKNTR